MMMIQITEGVLKGALEAEGFTDIESCIQDVELFRSNTCCHLKLVRVGSRRNLASDTLFMEVDVYIIIR